MLEKTRRRPPIQCVRAFVRSDYGSRRRFKSILIFCSYRLFAAASSSFKAHLSCAFDSILHVLTVRVCPHPQYVRLQLQFAGRRRVHEAEQSSHVVVSAGRQDELLDDEQRVFPTLTVLHDVVDATGAAELPEQGWRERDGDVGLDVC